MAQVSGYTCDTCKKFGPNTKQKTYPYYQRPPKGWWSVRPLETDDDPEFCSLDCLITWAEKEKKKPKKKAGTKKKPVAKRKPARKRKPVAVRFRY